MTRPLSKLALILWQTVLLLLLAHDSLAQKRGQFHIDYTVAVASTDEHLFHVTADVQNIDEPRLELSLPTWTPGWYTVENYFKNILRFRVTDSKNARLQPRMIRKQTWLVETKGLNRIKVEFDYRADVLALNQAKITNDFAFFTGTELFLMAANHRNSPSTVRFDAPPGWRIVSALKQTDATTFTAPDYDTLVDSPTQMGNFDLTEFEVEKKPHYLVTNPAGAFSKDKATKFAGMLAKVAKAQSAIFGGLPYEKYVYFYFFLPAESNARGALEHNNSFVAFAPPGQSATPEMIIGVASHEFFHLWNVKRFRPAEMWPYDYSRENETPLLWVSEGLTNYYGIIALYRAGLNTREQFIESVERAMDGVEGNQARGYISPANSSVSTWVGYDTPVAFGISYYTQGQNLGALLDLSIIHDTAGAFGLDDVMRALYREFYLKGKGFTTEDTIGIINRLTKRDYHDFYRQYVWGVEVPNYAMILGYAGYDVQTAPQSSYTIGISVESTPEGPMVGRVFRDSPASRVGLRVGDQLVSVDGLDLETNFPKALTRIEERIGQSVRLAFKRGGRDQVVDLPVDPQRGAGYRLAEKPNPTTEQLKVRETWLKLSK
ncbi:MAG: PDZ domain-containing protein [Blastocatellia bacterium]